VLYTVLVLTLAIGVYLLLAALAILMFMGSPAEAGSGDIKRRFGAILPLRGLDPGLMELNPMYSGVFNLGVIAVDLVRLL
jgi:hypothetical protein